MLNLPLPQVQTVRELRNPGGGEKKNIVRKKSDSEPVAEPSYLQKKIAASREKVAAQAAVKKAESAARTGARHTSKLTSQPLSYAYETLRPKFRGGANIPNRDRRDRDLRYVYCFEVIITMDAAIYKALSGAVVQMRRLDVTSQDLANANTAGYKGDRLAFSEVLARRAPAEDRPGGWVAVGDQRTLFGQGGIQTTGNPLNLALGEVLSCRQRRTLYSQRSFSECRRHGDHGARRPLLGEGGPLQITGRKIEVAGDGTVKSERGEVGGLGSSASPRDQSPRKANLLRAAPAVRGSHRCSGDSRQSRTVNVSPSTWFR
jgi:hypothetical protein